MNERKPRPIDHDAATLADAASRDASSDHAGRRRVGPPHRNGSGGASAPIRSFGKYELLRLLGEGGMGAVYEARQASPRRIVALKLIRPGLATPAMLRRFEIETQVLGRLHHPGIAQIFEAGTYDAGDGAQPYFAMEFVRGEPLDDHANRLRLGARERLDLLASVCGAVEHAHQKGVIHRDLKPGNILVTPEGRVKVLDFGVARSTDADVHAATWQTNAGQIVGTLPYMSPEQVAGDPGELDTRSDVYALGAVGYELLTGELPHDLRDRTLADAARVIEEQPIRGVSTHDRALRGDVETIIHTALMKERDRRYGSPAALQADIQRFLNDEPIAARPPSRMYQIRKFTRRNRALVTGVAAVFIMLVATVAIISQALVETTAARDDARAEARKSNALNQFLIADILGSADPAVLQGREMSVREALDAAASSIDAAFGNEPELQREIHMAVGNIYHSLGRYKEAEAHIDASLAIAESHDRTQPEELLPIERSLMLIYRDTDRLQEAVELSRAAAETARTTLGPNHPETALVLANLGSVQFAQGRAADAEASLARALPILEEHLGRDDRETLMARHNLITAIGNQGRLDEAMGQLRELLELRQQRYGPNHPDTLASMNNLATTCTELGRYDEAESLLRSVIERREQVLGDRHPATVNARMNLTHILLMQERRDEAEPLVRRNLEILEKSFGPDHQNALVCLNQLAYLLEDLGKLDEAEAIHRDAITRWERVTDGQPNANSLISRNNLAMLLLGKGDIGPAVQAFSELVERAASTLGAQHPYAIIFENNYGDALTQAGRYEEAEPVLLRTHEQLTAVLGEAHDRVAKAKGRLAALYEAWGRAEEAASWREEH